MNDWFAAAQNQTGSNFPVAKRSKKEKEGEGSCDSMKENEQKAKKPTPKAAFRGGESGKGWVGLFVLGGKKKCLDVDQ